MATPSEAAQRVFTGIIECACTIVEAAARNGGRSLEIDLSPLRTAPGGRSAASRSGPDASQDGGPDQPLAALSKRHHRRRGAAPLHVGDDDGLAAFHDRDDRVRRAEVDSDDL